MEIERIPTENPKIDQWRILGQFAYPANIHQYLLENNDSKTDSKLVENIAGCIQQAESYFLASENAPLDISPLLLYYGTSNLLTGISFLLDGKIKDLGHHGMKLEIPENNTRKSFNSLKQKLLYERRLKIQAKQNENMFKLNKSFRIADLVVNPCLPQIGALQYFCDVFSDNCPITYCDSWTVEEIFGSVPDLKTDFVNCYESVRPFTVKTNVLKMPSSDPVDENKKKEIFYERIEPIEFLNIEDIYSELNEVENFSQAYLLPKVIHGEDAPITIYRKPNFDEIGFYSIYGEKFLELPHRKNNKNLTPKQIIILFMGLFALGSVSRYQPQIWNPFVRADVTGERLLVEKFISISQRYIPNLILNLIREKRVEFYHPTNSVLVREENR